MFDPYELTHGRHLQAEDKISANDVSFHFIFFLPLAIQDHYQCI